MNHHIPTPSTIVLRLGAVLGATILAGTACTTGTSDETSNTELGTVEEIVLDESVGDDGVTERLIATVGTPASLAFEPVDTDVDVVAPWEVTSTEDCVGSDVAPPVASFDRGVVQQSGVFMTYAVAEFADERTASDAQGATWCFEDLAAATAAELGRAPGRPTLTQRQELGVEGGTQTEIRVSPPKFGDPGPTIFTGRIGTTVAVIVDLDNGLDDFDGPNLALELAAAG